MSWDDRDTKKVVELWREKASIKDIEIALGGRYSHSAVCGKIHRLRSDGVAGMDERPRKKRKRRAARRLPNVRGPVTAAPLPEEPPPPPWPPVKIMARGDHQCPFVIGEPDGIKTVMCGGTVAGGHRYCGFHEEYVQ